MPDPSPKRVSCPACGKGYRWDPSLAGRSIACKKCGEPFTIPDQPEGEPAPTETTPQASGHKPAAPRDQNQAPGSQAQAATSQGNGGDEVYELAEHPDDEAHTASAQPPAEQAAAPDDADQAAPPEPAVKPEGGEGGGEDAHEPKHMSEAAKAARREQQRIAAAEAEAAKTWRDYKWPIILVLLVCMLVLVILAMFGLSDLLDGYVDFASRSAPPPADTPWLMLPNHG